MSPTGGVTGGSGQPGHARVVPLDSKRSLLDDGGRSQRKKRIRGIIFSEEWVMPGA